MNISLKGNPKKKSLKFGLNAGAPTTGASKNVFGDDDDDDSDSDDDDNNNSIDHRQRVNQQIQKEQEALRKRAQRAAMPSSANDGNAAADIYDYDGAYDSFSKNSNDNKQGNDDNSKEKKGSKYIQDLLQAANQRKLEREMVLERKIAKEQHDEEQEDVELKGKERFITSAYKRKLEERNQWTARQDAQQREEEDNDVTKKTSTTGAGAAFATFYGNLNRQTMEKKEGGGESRDSKKDAADDDSMEEFRNHGKSGGRMGFLDGFERGGGTRDDDDDHVDSSVRNQRGCQSDNDEKKKENSDDDTEHNRLTLRERREKKVAEARTRYLERKKQRLQ